MTARILLKNLGLAVASGLLLVLSFPPFDLWMLAWIALVPLFYAVTDISLPKIAANLASLCGLLFYAIALFWMIHVFSIIAFSIWAYYTLWFTLSIVLLWRLWNEPLMPEKVKLWLWPFFAACLWVGIEYARSRMPLLENAWMLLGFSQTACLPLLQAGSLVGVYGLSLMIVWFNAAIISAFRREYRPLYIVCVILFLNFLWGWHRAAHLPVKIGDRVPVALLQYERSAIGNLLDISSSGEARRAKLLVWPEYSFLVSPERELSLYKTICKHFRDSSQIAVIPGAVVPDSLERNQIYNFAWVISSEGRLLGRYDKYHTVPLIESGVFRGAKWVPVDTPIGRLGIQICYDTDFEDGTRMLANAGAQLLVVPDDDLLHWTDWQHRQHSSMVPMRAVESGLWIVRAATSGYSQIIDPTGRIISQLKTGESGVVVGDVYPHNSRTFYSYIGWRLPQVCFVMVIIFSGLLLFRYGYKFFKFVVIK
ncbi:MAG: apolipoprotein N-acyltransferase [Elusimicrobia bacterium]|nr:apolipoprotein N-acyltransferase [Elusimicrobiota bacterium]